MSEKSKKNNKFYITTTIPYVNAPPHIGFALEVIQADIIARYHRLLGEEVVFNTGTDEHGLKIYRQALKEKKDPQQYVNEYAAKFEKLRTALNLSYTNFIRTTDPHHQAAAQEFWKLCDKSGDIYKNDYEVKYCVGCELEKTDSDLLEGHCPIHLNLELEIIKEENYFFRFSKYRDSLLAFYEKNLDFVIPDFRFQEIKNFVSAGLHDFSVSRLKSKMPWGVPVPGDERQVMYVWFDALVNYISTLGWPEKEDFGGFWPGVQIAGKDNLRQQSAMWQAMLMSAGLPNSKEILIHGFITSGGEKMSKSLGNVVDPLEIVEKYGTDALRYWLVGEVATFGDGDFTWEKFKESYNVNLANSLGNFAARISTLAQAMGEIRKVPLDKKVESAIQITRTKFADSLQSFRFHEALTEIWKLIRVGDLYLNERKPWTESDHEGKLKTIYSLVVLLDNISWMISSILPGTSEKITTAIKWVSDNSLTVHKVEQLFPRID